MSTPLHIVSWNLNGLDTTDLDPRMEAVALGLLMSTPVPDIILFQEVVDRALIAHLGVHLVGQGYRLVRQPAVGSYYVVALVRGGIDLQAANWHPLPGPSGRGLLVLDLVHESQRWQVATSHLESGPAEGEVRTAQAHAVLEIMAAHDGPAVFAGDTNLRDREIADVVEGYGFCDAWVAAGRPANHAGTWAPPSKRGAMPLFRFDRAWVNAQLTVLDLHTLQEGLTGDGIRTRVSDHLGLRLMLAVQEDQP